MADFIRTQDKYEDENGSFRYKYARPSLTADTVIFSVEDNQLYVLLIQRSDSADTEAGKWAIPGGFLRVYPTKSEPRIDYTIEDCGRRELEEEAHLLEARNLDLKLVGVFSKADRDDRGRVVTVAYYNLTNKNDVKGDDDAQDAQWFKVNELPDFLAFDHREIIMAALGKLRTDFQFDASAFRLLDKEGFTYRQMLDMYYAIYSDSLGDYRDFVRTQRANFINLFKGLDILDEISRKPDEMKGDPKHQEEARKLFVFNEKKYLAMVEKQKSKRGTRCLNLVGRY